MGVLLAAPVGPGVPQAQAQEPWQLGMVGSLVQELPPKGVDPAVLALSAGPLNQLVQDLSRGAARATLARDYEHLGRLLADGKVDFGLFHGVEFAWARQKYPGLRPLFILVNQRPYLRACLVVRRDNGVTDFADLKGRSCALAKGSRQHCRLFLEERCRQCGKGPGEHFSPLVTPCCVDDALEDVVDGEVQATVVDEVAVDCFREQKPGRFARLKVIQRSEVFPAGVVAYADGALDGAARRQFRDSLLRFARSPRARAYLTLCRLTGLAAVPEDYDATLREIAMAYQPPKNGALDWLLAGASDDPPDKGKVGESASRVEGPAGR
jgi:ABC-type phosphate/phosphonate transport system substrate-binding protein